MVEQAGHLVLQVADVDEELVLRLVDPFGLVQHHAGLGQEQADHEQRVAPELLVVLVPNSAMLKAAVLGAGHFLQHPLGPGLDVRKVFRVLRLVVQAGQGQHGGNGVDIAVGLLLPVEHVVIPGNEVVQDGLVAGLLVGFVDAVEGHAGGPLPVVHGQMAAGRVVAVGALEHAQHLVCDLLEIHVHSPYLTYFAVRASVLRLSTTSPAIFFAPYALKWVLSLWPSGKSGFSPLGMTTNSSAHFSSPSSR